MAPIEYNGKIYKSLRFLALEHGLTYACLRYRILERKMTLDQALTIPMRHKTPHSGILAQDHTGRRFDSMSAMARAWGLEPYIFFSRLRTYGDIKKCLTLTPEEKKQGWCHKCKDHLGNEYKSYKDLAAAWGINYYLFHTRIKQYRWTIKKALTTPPHSRKK